LANAASITSTASLIHTFSSNAAETVFIQIPAISPTVYLGPNSSVTSSNGLACGPGSKLYLTSLSSAAIYGITATGAQVTITWQAVTS
jgi:hypothetical protein